MVAEGGGGVAPAATLQRSPCSGHRLRSRAGVPILHPMRLQRPRHLRPRGGVTAPLGPMRYTDKVYKGEDDPELALYPGINVLSVKMVTLDDLKFPIHVYGTVVARDSLDRKCVYLFRRDEDQCQVINSESESLILTGPKRGLLLIDDTFVEIDLKIKDPRWQKDIGLSKGFVSVRSIRRLKNVVESKSLESRLSTVEVMYAVEKDAVEATIAIEVLGGKFNGEITACTTSIPDKLVLHDSKVAGKRGGCGKGNIQLLRSVVTGHQGYAANIYQDW